MNAKEAREKSLWNTINDVVREEIMYQVEIGFTELIFYNSKDNGLYQCLCEDKEYLKELGYKFEGKKIDNNGETDYLITLKW